jgi:hypothetical protein
MPQPVFSKTLVVDARVTGVHAGCGPGDPRDGGPDNTAGAPITYVSESMVTQASSCGEAIWPPAAWGKPQARNNLPYILIYGRPRRVVFRSPRCHTPLFHFDCVKKHCAPDLSHWFCRFSARPAPNLAMRASPRTFHRSVRSSWNGRVCTALADYWDPRTTLDRPCAGRCGRSQRRKRSVPASGIRRRADSGQSSPWTRCASGSRIPVRPHLGGGARVPAVPARGDVGICRNQCVAPG